jgi:putative addiction module component (TIGR02574 family)
MPPGVAAILSIALELPPDARAVLAEKLLESLDEKGLGEVDAAWAAEAQRRIAAFERGEMKALPAEKVLRGLSIRNKP